VPSRPRLPDHGPVPPSLARVVHTHAAAASSRTTAAHPEACRVPKLSQCAMRYITVPPHGCSTGSAQTPRPCAGSLPVASAPPGPGTSSPRAPRWPHRAPAVAHSPEAARPGPCAVIPNSGCDRNAAPAPPAHSRSAAPTPPAASLLPEPSRARPNASTGPEAGPPLRSATRPPLRPCPGPVAQAPPPAGSRRSPDNAPPARRPPLRSASAGRWPPTTPASADDAQAGAPEGAQDAAQVDGIPAASHASPRQLHCARGSIWD
jgi:hypothetical protein